MDFKKAFGLAKGNELRSKDGPLLGKINLPNISHVEKEQKERYEYPSTLDIELNTDQKITARKIEAALRNQTKERVVYSSYGSPYSCTITGIKVTELDEGTGRAQVKFLGKAVRRRDIPNLAQVKEEERKQMKKKSPAALKISKQGKKTSALHTKIYTITHL